jgi:DNA-binding NarL/FixJ family response regulator
VSAARVLLADDQALLRHGLHMMVDAQPDLEVVGEAADGVEAVELATRLEPDVVLMDIPCPAWTAWRPPAARVIPSDDPGRTPADDDPPGP